MFGNVRTEWWSITGIATYVIGGRNESRDVYLRFRDNSLIIHVSIFLTAAIYYLQGSECILPRTKRSRKSPLSIPFILRDRRFLSPLITEHPTPAHIFLRSPPVIFLIFARNWLNARWRHLALLASLPRFHAPIKIIFYSLNGRNERKKPRLGTTKVTPWSVISDCRCSFATLITGYVIVGGKIHRPP